MEDEAARRWSCIIPIDDSKPTPRRPRVAQASRVYRQGARSGHWTVQSGCTTATRRRWLVSSSEETRGDEGHVDGRAG